MPPMLHIAFAELARGGAQQDARGSAPVRHAPAPSRPATGRGIRRRRRIDKTRSGPRGGSSRSDIAASRWPSRSRQGRACPPFTAPRVRFQYAQTPSSAARLASARRKRRIRFCASAGLRPTPRRKLVSRSWPSGQIEGDLHRAARIQSRADFAGQARASQCRRLRQASVAAEEFLPVAGERARGIVHVQEHDAVGEFGVVSNCAPATRRS